MRIRSNRGSTIVMIASCMIVLVMLAMAFLGLNLQLGGKRQMQQALDAGTLNFTKFITALSNNGTQGVGVQLQPGVEQTNFGQYAINNQIDLLHYNACVGQSVLVALNAMEENTPQAAQNAAQVLNAVQAGQNSLGQRLSQAMIAQAQPSNQYGNNTAFGQFLLAANGNSISMNSLLDGNKKININPNGAAIPGYANAYNSNSQNQNPMAIANVSINPSIYSPSIQAFVNSFISTANPDSNNPGGYFMNGYQPITFPLQTGPITIMAVSMAPNQGPHLGTGVNTLFNSSTPYSSKSGAVPPNSFLIAASVNQSGPSSTQQMLSTISGVAGSWNYTFQPSIANGYVEVTNPKGLGFPGIPNFPDPSQSVFNNELMTGIFITNNGCFSTDQNLLNDWVVYNNSGQKGTQPSNVGIFNASGVAAQASDLSQIVALGQNDQNNNSVAECTWLSFSSSSTEAPCVNLGNAFQLAYGANATTSLPAETLISVEAAAAQVINDYSNNILHWGQFSYNIAGSTSPDSYVISGSNGNTATIGSTGLQAFDHNQIYIVQSGANQKWNPVADVSTVVNKSVSFSKPGSIWTLLSNIQNGSRSALLSPLTADNNGAAVSLAQFEANLKNSMAKGGSTQLGSLIRRIVQLQPNKSIHNLANDLYNILVNTQIPMDSHFYIAVNYKAPKENDGTYPIQISMTVPTGYNPSNPQLPDGNAQSYVCTYPVIGLSVDPHYELGIHDQLFTCYYGDLQGNDSAIWYPSSGYNNLVGKLVFSNYLTGSENFSAAN